MKKRNPFLLKLKKLLYAYGIDVTFSGSDCLVTRTSPFVWIRQDADLYFLVSRRYTEKRFMLRADSPIDLFLKMLKHNLIEIPPMTMRQLRGAKSQMEIDFEILKHNDYEITIKKVS